MSFSRGPLSDLAEAHLTGWPFKVNLLSRDLEGCLLPGGTKILQIAAYIAIHGLVLL